MISIIVITYNSGKTIVETLDSINNQTFKDFEVIVSDDCSKDNTIEVVTNWFASHDVRGKIVPGETNKGIPHNVNKGIRNAKGNLIKIIAGDDLLFPNALEVFMEYYMKDSGVIWQSEYSCFGNDSQRVEEANSIELDWDFYKKNNKQQYKTLVVGNRLVAPAIGLIEKQIYNKYGLYDEQYKMMEDYPYYLKLSKNGITYRLIKQKLVGYRISDSSVMGMASKSFYQCMSDFYFKERIKDIIKIGNIKELLIQSLKYGLIRNNLLIKKIDGNYRIIKI